MSEEVWKSIPSYEGYYKASDLGKIRSLNRYVKRLSNSKAYLKGKILKLGKDLNGYPIIDLHFEGNKKTYSVHVLVMLAFEGRPFKGAEVAHNNGVRDDNRLTNLRYATSSENSYDTLRHSTSSAKLTEEKVKEIRQKAKNCSQKVLTEEYGVTQATISSIITRRTWKHI